MPAYMWRAFDSRIVKEVKLNAVLSKTLGTRLIKSNLWNAEKCTRGMHEQIEEDDRDIWLSRNQTSAVSKLPKLRESLPKTGPPRFGSENQFSLNLTHEYCRVPSVTDAWLGTGVRQVNHSEALGGQQDGG